jgi:hypothetical protein
VIGVSLQNIGGEIDDQMVMSVLGVLNLRI